MDSEEIDGEWLHVSKQWLQAHKQRKAFEEQEKVFREELIRLAGAKRMRGGGVSLTCTIQKGAIEYSKIPELQNVNLDAYRKESAMVWRLVALKGSAPQV